MADEREQGAPTVDSLAAKYPYAVGDPKRRFDVTIPTGEGKVRIPRAMLHRCRPGQTEDGDHQLMGAGPDGNNVVVNGKHPIGWDTKPLFDPK